MTPTPADLIGVTVGGEPLASVLARELEERKREEAEDAAEREVREKRRVILRHSKAGPLPAETSRVSQRARHLTPDEIRKEYGIMQSPYSSQIENVLWVIRENGPISPVAIAKQLSVKPIRIQGVCSLLWRTMKHCAPPLMFREMKGGSYLYRTADLQVTVEQMYSAYREAKVWKTPARKPKTKRVEIDITPKSGRKTPSERLLEMAQPLMGQDKDGKTRMVEVIERAVEKEFGVKVEVSGRVDIVIRFER
jgi:hypothetical protein